MAVDGTAISADSSHAYVPPQATDSRSPCPALNILANHGYLPRDGRALTKDMLYQAVKQVFNVDARPFSLNKIFYARDDPAHPEGLLLPGKDTIDLEDLNLPNKVEHEVSLTRHDRHLADSNKPDPALVAALKAATSSSTTTHLTATDITRHRVTRYAHSKQHNAQNMVYTTKELVLSLGQDAFILYVFGRDGMIPLEYIDDFFLLERIPNGWTKREQEFNFNSMVPLVASGLARFKWATLW
ncbi:hypothetical protein HK100_002741 [Physocladia obscura]|uniref:Heme haloperoxidase family profile domain-containing protein n=1 Tax=Physocladia obscura TaxID=109957 RepID=A0AAD5XF72_9FUNG|nr:hypothetical protein HK100_002741 [Physocladia obscura]